MFSIEEREREERRMENRENRRKIKCGRKVKKKKKTGIKRQSIIDVRNVKGGDALV